MTPVQDRRRATRHDRKVEFFCYVDGCRFDSSSLNLSASGAYLLTDDPVRDGARVVMSPKGLDLRRLPALLIGTVVRRQDVPPPGVGILWVRCLSRGGVESIRSLAECFPEVFPNPLPEPPAELRDATVVGYTLGSASFYAPDFPSVMGDDDAPSRRAPAAAPRPPAPAAATHPPAPAAAPRPSAPAAASRPSAPAAAPRPPAPAAAPRAPAPVLPQPAASLQESVSILEGPRFHRAAGDGPVTQTIMSGKSQFAVSMEAALHAGLARATATLVSLGISRLFVTVPPQVAREMKPGEKVTVTLRIPLHRQDHPVVLACTVDSSGKDPLAGRIDGFTLAVVSVNHGGKPGVFERFVKFLYYKQLSV